MSANVARADLAGGVAWLASQQDASGLWAAGTATPARDAAAAVVALKALNGDPLVIIKGLNAINSMQTGSTDYLARRILANAMGGGASDVSGHGLKDLNAMVTALGGQQNADGGWGYNNRYASNLLETALALQALKSAAYSNTTTLGAGLGYLVSHQNADHGWAFTSGDTSRVYITAHVLLALEALRNNFNVASQISSGTTWLEMQDHGDGGFGTGPLSNTYETALSIMALAPVDSLALEIPAAENYLVGTQRPDGSWNTDVYNTALALQVLRASRRVAVETGAPKEFQFSASPNPARGSAIVDLALPRAATVSLAVYDVSGRIVTTLLRGPVSAGARRLTWNLRSDEGVPVPSGAYYMRFSSRERTLTRKVIVTQ